MQLERMQSENIASGTPRGRLVKVEERGKRGGGRGRERGDTVERDGWWRNRGEGVLTSL